jgi:hypothetical protein
VSRIDTDGAARLLQWLGHHAGTYGRLAEFALLPVTTLNLSNLIFRPSASVVPFERFLLPSQLSGA